MADEPAPHLAEQTDRLFLTLKSMPELLQTGRTYGELTPVVIKAIQELKANLNKLEAIEDKLRADFDVYKTAHS